MLFGSGIVGRGALYTSAMQPRDDTERRKTVRTLIELAEGSSPADCWDDRRAEDLLRSQSTPEEVRELGMSEQMIERIFGGAPPASVGPAIQPANEALSRDAGKIAGATQRHRYVVRVEARFEAAHYL